MQDDLLKKFKRDPAKVMVSIMKQQRSLFKQEIKSWKNARVEALDPNNPRRILLTELYEEIKLDAFIHGVTENRILRITNKPFKIVGSDDQEDTDKTDLLKKQWFRMLTRWAIESRYHGHSLVYLWGWNGGRVTETKLVPRDHVRPESGKWVINPYDFDGFDYNKSPYDKYMLGIGQSDDLGLFEKAAPLHILKKHSWGSWDEFEELFGVPVRWAKTASTDPKVTAEIDKWLREMGSAAYGRFPIDTEFDIKESKSRDAYNVFNEKRKACNEELEILIKGLKNLTEGGGTYGKQQVIEGQEGEVVEDDKAFVRDLVNDQLIPMLRSNGYPFTDQDRFAWDEVEWQDPKDKLEIYKGVHDMGFNVDPEQLTEELGVRILGTREDQNEPGGFNPFLPGNHAGLRLIKMHKKLKKPESDV